MTEVRIAVLAEDFSADHAQAIVSNGPDVVFGQRQPEARPPRARIILVIRAEKRRATANTSVSAGFFARVIFTGKGAFSPFLTANLVLFGGQLVPPFGLGFNDFLHTESPLKYFQPINWHMGEAVNSCKPYQVCRVKSGHQMDAYQ